MDFEEPQALKFSLLIVRDRAVIINFLQFFGGRGSAGVKTLLCRENLVRNVYSHFEGLVAT